MVASGIFDSDSEITMDFPAVPENLAAVRREIERAAVRANLPRIDLEDFLTAVDEAVANAIRHGSPRLQRDRVSVVCRPLPGGLEVEVRDHGRGFAAPFHTSMPGPLSIGGRGLPLMCALTDTLKVESTPAGTCVTLRKQIGLS